MFGAVPTNAVAASAVATTGASPAAFVPDWDGHTDSTVIEYRLVERSFVTVRILDRRGRTVAMLFRGVRLAGTHHTSWDGRATNGRVGMPGAYRVRVDAKPRPSAAAGGTPGAAALGGVVTAGGRDETVRLQSSPLVVRGVRLSRPTVGRSAKVSRTVVQFELSHAAWISVAVVDSRGRAVRTLAASRMSAGRRTLAWNGGGRRGSVAPDGDYSLVLSATGGARPTATTRVPLRVDRTLPGLRTDSRSRALVAASGVALPVNTTVGETSTVTYAVGRRTTTRTLGAGTHRVRIPGDELGIGGARRARTYRLRVTAVDQAGNAVARVTSVHIPASPRATRPTRPSRPSTSIRPGTLPWPTGGVLTSPFGMRGGRPHTGIDIGSPTGEAIHPVAPGTVSYVGALGGYGNLVMVDHASGLRTYYAHMSRFGGFAVGATVTPADTIGYVGCTGNCTGPHVHFETRVADVPRDPLGYLVAR